MTPQQVMEQGEGWYWWRLRDGWPWQPVNVQCIRGEYWLADGTLLSCPANRKLEKGGEYEGPIDPPDDRGGEAR